MNEWYPKEVLGKSIVLRFPMNIFVKMFSFNVLKHKFKMLKEIPHSVGNMDYKHNNKNCFKNTQIIHITVKAAY